MHTPEDLKKLLVEIFADGYVDPNERERLQAFQSHLSDAKTIEVFSEFMNTKWGEAMKDGVLSSDEKRLLGHILSELALQLSHLPLQAQLALKDHV